MMNTQQKQVCSSKSNKGQIINIDGVVAYSLFIGIVLFLVNYILNMTAPFTNNINWIIKEKNTEVVKNMFPNEFELNNLNDLCNINYTDLRRTYVKYTINSFFMPHYDNGSGVGDIIFIRNGSTLNLKINLSTPTKIILNFKPEAQISGEINGTVSSTINNYNYQEITINASEANLNIKPIEGLVIFEIKKQDLSNAYVGNVKISNSCGYYYPSDHTSFNRFVRIINNNEIFYGFLEGDLWWTN